ncbi:hypothetical protein F444_13007 [Phytophthora nicotianae P1976]|uniref:Uncharacterized protein n=1 Tax=Phytophthora nicotianae P1976 TaxID=1317066 RepID=A0A080ZV67_PHYNI|nr:hypothetical protein F444_13007 [Phytophthora nicotianae P1976]
MRELARMLSNLPVNSMVLDENSLIRYFKQAMPNDWKRAYEGSGISLTHMHQTVQYFEQLEQSERWQHKEHGVPQKPGKQNSQKGANQRQTGKWCKLHKTASHNDSEYFTQKKTANSSSHPKASAKKADKTKWTHVEDVVKSDSDPEYHYSRA